MANNWMSMHIFYAGNPEPLLLDAIEPLIKDLRERSFIQRFFFIRYWQEGPHVRLRLLPAEGVAEQEVRRVAEEALSAYLKRYPSLYTLESQAAAPYYKEMFVAEYSLEKWRELYGERDDMPMRPNNSVHAIPYEPEYGRYGGPYGMEVSEWHFEKSSEIALQLIRTTNLHVRPILLGLSAQLAVALCLGLHQDRQQVLGFFARYEKFWLESYFGSAITSTEGFEKKFGRMAPSLQRRLLELEESVLGGKPEKLTQIEQEWMDHVRELKARLDALTAEKRLIFQHFLTGNQPLIFDDPAWAYSVLLTSYVHMMNNRLGTTIQDEIYLAYLIRRALEESNLAASGVHI